jgi:superfamily II DNA or RNA helicase
MEIIKERTRLIFNNYTKNEKIRLENQVASMDNVFMYVDKDKQILGLPTGLESTVKKMFPEVKFIDNSDQYWSFAKINPVQHEMKPRNQLQIDAINFILENAKKKQKLACILSPGQGKCEPNSRKIPTPDGYKLMGDIRSGDYVFRKDGCPTKVLATYPQGEKDVYRITFSDGRYAECGAEHLWNVYTNHNVDVQTLQLKDIIEEYRHNTISIPTIDDNHYVCFNSIDIVKDPYEIGYKINPMKEYEGDNTIPDSYIYNSYDVRINLLKGLFDYNGIIDLETGEITYEAKSIELLKTIRNIIISLGKMAVINGHTLIIEAGIQFKFDLFRNLDKLKQLVNAKLIEKNKYLDITNIELIRREECTCITVDAPDELYLTEDFIVTHNTFIACYCAIAVGMRTLIIAPTSAIKQQWADTLTGMFNVANERVLVVKNPSQMVNVDADFVIVSQSSLSLLNNKYDLEKILKDSKYGIKVVDEVQMFFANIINVDANSNFANNWYITGTFGRSGDKENEIYQEMFGDLAKFVEKDKNPTIFNRKPGNIYGMKPHMHCKMIWAHSGLTKEEIKSVTNSMRYSEREGKWVRYGISIPKYMNLVIPENGKMTKFLKTILTVVKQAEKEVKYGHTLVLGNTISSAEIVAKNIRKMFPDKKVYTYHSKNTKEHNEEAKAKADIIVSTTQSAGTGFDWKGLGKLIVFNQYKSWILADQISGRLRRRDDGKDTYMWDIVDADIKQLRIWANSRADVERRKSKTFKVVDMN